jgi:hypothetical protein
MPGGRLPNLPGREVAALWANGYEERRRNWFRD